tara:strand:+ start:1367 stop:1999 length:633 start_codon:yes stop_codon:yes gene_type:complete
MDITPVALPVYEPGFNIETGEVFDRVGGNINFDIRSERNGKYIPEHVPLFIPRKKNQTKYVCLCDSSIGGTELNCYTKFVQHCKKRTHITWLQEQEKNSKSVIKIFKKHLTNSNLEQKKEVTNLKESLTILNNSLNKLYLDNEDKTNNINRLTRECNELEQEKNDLKKKLRLYKKEIIKERKKNSLKKEYEQKMEDLEKEELKEIDEIEE